MLRSPCPSPWACSIICRQEVFCKRGQTHGGCDQYPESVRPHASGGEMVSLLEREKLLCTQSRAWKTRILYHHSPAQRHWLPAYRARAVLHYPRYPHPLAQDAGLQHPVRARHRPRGHRHPERGGEAIAPRGSDAPRPRQREVLRARVGLGTRVRRGYPHAVPAAGMLPSTGAAPASRWTKAM